MSDEIPTGLADRYNQGIVPNADSTLQLPAFQRPSWHPSAEEIARARKRLFGTLGLLMLSFFACVAFSVFLLSGR